VILVTELVEKYFEHWKTKRDDLAWAWDEVTDKVFRSPSEAWPLIIELIRTAPNDAALSYVAAGPLEDFLCKHGESFMGRVATAVDQEPRFKQALQGVWKNSMKQWVWVEVLRLSGRTGK
jgi:hypothetical protein